MTDPTLDHGEQKPETVEDLAPREDESAGLKGGLVVGTLAHGTHKS